MLRYFAAKAFYNTAEKNKHFLLTHEIKKTPVKRSMMNPNISAVFLYYPYFFVPRRLIAKEINIFSRINDDNDLT